MFEHNKNCFLSNQQTFDTGRSDYIDQVWDEKLRICFNVKYFITKDISFNEIRHTYSLFVPVHFVLQENTYLYVLGTPQYLPQQASWYFYLHSRL